MNQRLTVPEELVKLTQGQEPFGWYYFQRGLWYFTDIKSEWYNAPDAQEVTPLYTAPIPSQQEERVREFDSAFAKGWRASAVFGNRTDLIADIGSPAYVSIRDAARNKEKSK